MKLGEALKVFVPDGIGIDDLVKIVDFGFSELLIFYEKNQDHGQISILPEGEDYKPVSATICADGVVREFQLIAGEALPISMEKCLDTAFHPMVRLSNSGY